MTERRAYKISLMFPALLPILAGILIYSGFAKPVNTIFEILLVVIAFSGAVGGIPYVIVIGGTLIWIRNRSIHEFKSVLLISPILMVPIQLLTLLAWVIWQNSSNKGSRSDNFIAGMGNIALCDLIFGYIYIGITFTIVRILKNNGFFEDEVD
jgi:uncharacterized membrane protein